MKASWEKTEKNQGVLEIEVNAEQVALALDKAFKKVAPKVNVPGFRKGKVPRQIFEAKFGVESLYQDAIDFILPDAYTQAVEETGIEPVDRPEVDFEEFVKGQPFKFTAKVIVKPEVQLGEYKGIEIVEQDLAVSAEEIAAELERMQQRHAELVVIEEGPAENGDITIIDFEGFVDGEAFEGGQAEKYSLELGSNSFIPGFEEQLIGLTLHGEKEVNVTFPEDYQSTDLAGKEAVFKVKLHEIKRKNLPELDDEFAKDVSEFDTLEEYKQDVENNLAEKKKQENLQYRESAVVDKATESAEIDVPEAMINTEVEQMLRDFANRLRMQGMQLDMYYQFSGQTEEALKEQMRGDAEKKVRSSLVLEAIAKAEDVAASDEEVDAELEKLAAMYQQTADEIRDVFTANGNMEGLKKEVIARKTVDLLIELSKNVPEAV